MNFFKKNIKSMISVLVLLLCSVGWVATAQSAPTTAEYGVVLNLSGKQRMLSQKMSKEVSQIALKTSTQENLQSLAATAALFDKTLKGLRDGDASLGLPATDSKRIIRQLDKVSTIWDAFFPVIQEVVAAGAVTPEQVQIISSQNLPLLKEMNKAVGLYEKDAKKNGLEAAPGLAATINLSGKQRMLSQKMSKEYFLIGLGHDVENNKISLLETYSLFDRTLVGLLDGDKTLGLPGTKQQHIRDQLNTVQALWSKFKPLMELGADYKTEALTSEQIQAVAATNLPLLREMDAAVKLYELEASK
mgnify:FL=1|tara:strand:+ start:2774 stop:3682 length:909 start_codon:yes stop_codon:yes gene_type:complete